MPRQLKFALIAAILLGMAGPSVGGSAWRLVLPDSVTIDGKVARLADIAAGPVPAAAADLVIHAGGRPHTVVTVTRQGVLRRLVSNGLASGVVIDGAAECHLVFEGRTVAAEELEHEIRRSVQPLVPGARPGAPASWIEIQVPESNLAVSGAWETHADRRDMLEPGRNLVQVAVSGEGSTERIPVVVILHQYGQTATAVTDIAPSTGLQDAQFAWKWTDLAERRPGLVTDPGMLVGKRSAAAIKTGQSLRLTHLEDTPLIRAGDLVELRVMRGQVAVTVRALARQAGCLGQMIPVRNELTGRLVNAQVAGPGLVEWRR
jgi:flagella basal body P-ring formation protein FlgA